MALMTTEQAFGLPPAYGYGAQPEQSLAQPQPADSFTAQRVGHLMTTEEAMSLPPAYGFTPQDTPSAPEEGGIGAAFSAGVNQSVLGTLARWDKPVEEEMGAFKWLGPQLPITLASKALRAIGGDEPTTYQPKGIVEQVAGLAGSMGADLPLFLIPGAATLKVAAPILKTFINPAEREILWGLATKAIGGAGAFGFHGGALAATQEAETHDNEGLTDYLVDAAKVAWGAAKGVVTGAVVGLGEGIPVPAFAGATVAGKLGSVAARAGRLAGTNIAMTDVPTLIEEGRVGTQEEHVANLAAQLLFKGIETTIGISKWARENPDRAKAIADNPAPSRKDVAGVLPVGNSAADRAALSETLRRLVVSEEGNTPIDDVLRGLVSAPEEGSVRPPLLPEPPPVEAQAQEAAPPAVPPTAPEPLVKRHAVLDALEQNPETQPLLAMNAGVKEGYTVGEHTRRVMDVFEEQHAPEELARIDSYTGANVSGLMRWVVALHDIGKGLSASQGKKSAHHEATAPILDKVLSEQGLGDQERALGRALAGNDILGEFLQGQRSVKDAYRALRNLYGTLKTALTFEDFFSLQKSLYKADAGSYPSLAVRIFDSSVDGKLRIKSLDFRTLEEAVYGQGVDDPGFGGLGQRGTVGDGSNKGGLIRTYHGTGKELVGGELDPAHAAKTGSVGKAGYTTTLLAAAQHYAERYVFRFLKNFSRSEKDQLINMSQQERMSAADRMDALAAKEKDPTRKAKLLARAKSVRDVFEGGGEGRIIETDIPEEGILSLGSPEVGGRILSEPEISGVIAALPRELQAKAKSISTRRGTQWYIEVARAVGGKEVLNRAIVGAGYHTIHFVHPKGGFTRAYDTFAILDKSRAKPVTRTPDVPAEPRTAEPSLPPVSEMKLQELQREAGVHRRNGHPIGRTRQAMEEGVAAAREIEAKSRRPIPAPSPPPEPSVAPPVSDVAPEQPPQSSAPQEQPTPPIPESPTAQPAAQPAAPVPTGAPARMTPQSGMALNLASAFAGIKRLIKQGWKPISAWAHEMYPQLKPADRQSLLKARGMTNEQAQVAKDLWADVERAHGNATRYPQGTTKAGKPMPMDATDMMNYNEALQNPDIMAKIADPDVRAALQKCRDYIDDMTTQAQALGRMPVEVDNFDFMKPFEIAALAKKLGYNHKGAIKDIVEDLRNNSVHVIDAIRNMSYKDLQSVAGILSVPEKGGGKTISGHQPRAALISDIEEALTPRPSVFEANKGSYIHRSYRAWTDAKWKATALADKFRMSEAGKWLWERTMELEGRSLTAEEIYDRLYWLLSEGKDAGAMEQLMRTGRVGAMDITPLKGRKDLPLALRDLLGEVHDAKANFFHTANHLINIVTQTQFQNEVAARGLGEGYFSVEPSTSPDGQQLAYRIAIDSLKQFGALNNLYTTKEIFQAFDQMFQKKDMNMWLKAYVNLNSIVKISKTTLSAGCQVVNFAGNFMIQLGNGNVSIHGITDAGRAVLVDWGKLTDAKSRSKLREYLRMNVIDENPGMLDLREGSIALEQACDYMTQHSASAGVARGLKASLKWAERLYSAGDNIHKAFAYECEKRKHMKYAGMTEQQASEIAAIKVRKLYATLSEVSRPVAALRHIPLANSFITFTSEMLRTSKNWFLVTAEELATPGMRAIGAQRLAGMVAAQILAPLALDNAGSLFGGTQGQDKDDLRRFMAPWDQDSRVSMLGTDKAGQYRYWAWGRLNPYNFMHAPVLAFMRGEDWESSLKDSFAKAANPFWGPQIPVEYGMAVLYNEKEGGGKLYNQFATLPSKIGDVVTAGAQVVEPGTLTSMRKVSRAMQGVIEPGGTARQVSNEMLSMFGLRTTSIDVKQALAWKAKKFMTDLQEADRNVRHQLTNRGTVTTDELNQGLQDTRHGRYDVFREMTEDVAAAMRLLKSEGNAKSEVANILKSNGVTKSLIVSLLKDQAPAFVPTKETLVRAYKTDPSRVSWYKGVAARQRAGAAMPG